MGSASTDLSMEGGQLIQKVLFCKSNVPAKFGCYLLITEGFLNADVEEFILSTGVAGYTPTLLPSGSAEMFHQGGVH